MTTISTLENKITSVRKYLKTLDRYKKYSEEEIINNIDLKGAVERYLYLACQATIDLAEAIISYKNFRRPSSLNESFYILQEENFINQDLAKNLVDMVGFRNVVAHDYEKINYDIVYDVLKNKLSDLEEFLNIAENLK